MNEQAAFTRYVMLSYAALGSQHAAIRLCHFIFPRLIVCKGSLEGHKHTRRRSLTASMRMILKYSELSCMHHSLLAGDEITNHKIRIEIIKELLILATKQQRIFTSWSLISFDCIGLVT